MAMNINVKNRNYCAICKYSSDITVHKYDVRTGIMSVDNSKGYCEMKRRNVLPTANACNTFERNYQY